MFASQGPFLRAGEEGTGTLERRPLVRRHAKVAYRLSMGNSLARCQVPGTRTRAPRPNPLPATCDKIVPWCWAGHSCGPEWVSIQRDRTEGEREEGRRDLLGGRKEKERRKEMDSEGPWSYPQGLLPLREASKRLRFQGQSQCLWSPGPSTHGLNG